MLDKHYDKFVNIINDYESGRGHRKALIAAHAAHVKHGRKRIANKNEQTQVQGFTPTTPFHQSSGIDIDQTDLTVRQLHDVKIAMAILAPPMLTPKIPSHLKFHHYLLPPAFNGIEVPPSCLQQDGFQVSFAHFAYLNSIPYHQVASFIFDTDTLYFPQRDEAPVIGQVSYAMGALLRLMLEWSENDISPPSEVVLKNMQRAIIRLRRMLENGINLDYNVLIVELIGLASVALLIGDVEAFQVHSNMMQFMMQSHSDVRVLKNPRMLETIMKTFFPASTSDQVYQLVSRRFASLCYDLSPRSPEGPELDLITHEFPPGFHALACRRPPNFRTIAVLRRMKQLMNCGDIDRFLAQYSQFPKTFVHLANSSPETFRTYTGGPSVDRLLDLALLLFIHVGFGRPASNRIFLWARWDLQRCVKLFTAHDQADEEFLIWTWVVAIEAWRSRRDFLLPAGEVLRTKLRGCLPATNHRQYVLNVVKHFFLTPRLLHKIERFW